MNLNYENTLKNIGNVLFSKYVLYIFFPVVVFINIVLFPDLLNHNDIKLNDLSYLLPQKEILNKIPDQPIISVNTTNSVYKEPHTYNTETCVDHSPDTHQSNIQSKDENISGEAILSISKTNTNITTTTSNSNNSSLTSESVLNKTTDVKVNNETIVAETSEIKDDSSISAANQEKNNTSNIGLDKDEKTNSRSAIEVENKESTNGVVDVKKENKFLPNEDSIKNSEPIPINKTNDITGNENKQFENNTKTVIIQPNEKTESVNTVTNTEDIAKQSPNLPSTPSTNSTTKTPKFVDSNESGNFYTIIVFLIILAFTTSMGLFIYSHFDSLKMALNFGKSPNFREYISSGYELLQD
jgi:hypothetical protein